MAVSSRLRSRRDRDAAVPASFGHHGAVGPAQAGFERLESKARECAMQGGDIEMAMRDRVLPRRGDDVDRRVEQICNLAREFHVADRMAGCQIDDALAAVPPGQQDEAIDRSEEHTSELQSL